MMPFVSVLMMLALFAFQPAVTTDPPCETSVVQHVSPTGVVTYVVDCIGGTECGEETPCIVHTYFAGAGVAKHCACATGGPKGTVTSPCDGVVYYGPDHRPGLTCEAGATCIADYCEKLFGPWVSLPGGGSERDQDCECMPPP